MPAANSSFQKKIETEILLCSCDTPNEVLNIIFILLIKLKGVTTTQLTHSFGIHGRENGQFRSPYGIATFHDGRIVVADSRNCRIQIFSQNGEFLSKFGTRGSGDGEFDQLE